MNADLNGQVKTLPPMADYILTHRIPCAALAFAMFTAAIWGSVLAGIPALAAIVSLLGLTLHLLTPALFAVIVFGGGLIYALQVAAIAALAVTALTGFSLMSGLAFLLMYAVVPSLAAVSMTRDGGTRRSAQQLALGLFLAAMVALLAGASSQGVSMHQFAEQIVAPIFDVLATAIPASEVAALDALEQTKQMTAWVFPGFLAFSLWLAWWMDILLGRKIAVTYGFYRGDHSEMLMIKFDKAVGVALLIAAALANLLDGSVQYIALSAAIVLAGMLAIQGVSIAHLWLRARKMQVTLVVMYLLLLIWSAMIIPFIIVGLLDIWFDFRRNFISANGEE